MEQNKTLVLRRRGRPALVGNESVVGAASSSAYLSKASKFKNFTWTPEAIFELEQEVDTALTAIVNINSIIHEYGSTRKMSA